MSTGLTATDKCDGGCTVHLKGAERTKRAREARRRLGVELEQCTCTVLHSTTRPARQLYASKLPATWLQANYQLRMLQGTGSHAYMHN